MPLLPEFRTWLCEFYQLTGHRLSEIGVDGVIFDVLSASCLIGSCGVNNNFADFQTLEIDGTLVRRTTKSP